MTRSYVLGLALLVCILSISAGQDKPKNELEKGLQVQELAKQIDKGSVAGRVKALQAAAELGRADAKPLLQNIVVAMMSTEKEVRAAATDTLKTLDDNLHGIAVKLLVNPNEIDFENLNTQGADAIIPLAPFFVKRVEGVLTALIRNRVCNTKNKDLRQFWVSGIRTYVKSRVFRIKAAF